MIDKFYDNYQWDNRAVALQTKYGLRDPLLSEEDWLKLWVEIRQGRFKDKNSLELDHLELDHLELILTLDRSFLLAECRKAIDDIQNLLSQGWTNHGCFNNSTMVTPWGFNNDNPIYKKFRHFKAKNIPHKTIAFLFGDDDVPCWLLSTSSSTNSDLKHQENT